MSITAEEMERLRERVGRIIYERHAVPDVLDQDRRAPWRDEPWQTTTAQVIKEVMAAVSSSEEK